MKRTEIIVITDRSGSMDKIRDDVIGGYNAFLAEQKEQPGEARVTFCEFNHAHVVLYQARPIADAPLLDRTTFVPCGNTALYDAIGSTLNVQGARIKKAGWAELVVVQIITDGEENASREFKDVAQIKAMIEQHQKDGWVFLFLAANQDAFAAGGALGISAGTTANYSADAVGTMNAYVSASSMTNALRSGVSLAAAPTLSEVMASQETV